MDGNKNIVNGSYNVGVGNNSIINGHANAGFGSNLVINGSANEVHGSNSIVVGDRNSWYDWYNFQLNIFWIYLRLGESSKNM